MNKYINVDELRTEFWTPDDKEYSYADICKILDEMPSADVVEVKHGKNLNDQYAECDQFICSNCSIELQDWDRIVRAGFKPFDEIWEFEFNYCPNCGAIIRGKTE